MLTHWLTPHWMVSRSYHWCNVYILRCMERRTKEHHWARFGCQNPCHGMERWSSLLLGSERSKLQKHTSTAISTHDKSFCPQADRTMCLINSSLLYKLTIPNPKYHCPTTHTSALRITNSTSPGSAQSSPQSPIYQDTRRVVQAYRRRPREFQHDTQLQNSVMKYTTPAAT
jgi:hypothetical protein